MPREQRMTVKLNVEKECLGATDYQGRHYRANKQHEVTLPRSAALDLINSRAARPAGAIYGGATTVAATPEAAIRVITRRADGTVDVDYRDTLTATVVCGTCGWTRCRCR